MSTHHLPEERGLFLHTWNIIYCIACLLLMIVWWKDSILAHPAGRYTAVHMAASTHFRVRTCLSLWFQWGNWSHINFTLPMPISVWLLYVKCFFVVTSHTYTDLLCSSFSVFHMQLLSFFCCPVPWRPHNIPISVESTLYLSVFGDLGACLLIQSRADLSGLLKHLDHIVTCIVTWRRGVPPKAGLLLPWSMEQ